MEQETRIHINIQMTGVHKHKMPFCISCCFQREAETANTMDTGIIAPLE